MEIISYVHQETHSGFSFSRFSKNHQNRKVAKKTEIIELNARKERKEKRNLLKAKKLKKQRNAEIDFSSELFGESISASMHSRNYAPGIKEFTLPKVKSEMNIHLFAANIGSTVTNLAEFLFRHIFKIVAGILVAVTVTAGAFAGNTIYRKNQDFTGPLVMNSDETAETEYLERLMNAFALESGNEVDELGNLIGSEIVAANYTQPVTYQNYKVVYGDTISGITKKFGLKNISTLIAVNDIGNVRQLAAGQKLKIPSIDGITYTVKDGDTLESIMKKNNIKLSTLLDVNDLTSENLSAGQVLFLPGASLDSKTLKMAMGDKFIMPISASFRWTSPYGARKDPITGVQSFHKGTDMACPTGTPILAAMSGKVITAGVSRIYGNYVIIEHGNGYQTLYGHMSKILAAKGQWVSQGTRIGLVGSTGYSTGPHLHFTVYKNGQVIDPMTILK